MFYRDHKRVSLDCGGPEASKTRQEFRDECDINTIMKKFERDGSVSHVAERRGDYGDFSDVVDYQTAMNSLLDARAAFAGLPAKLRRDFDNDPGRFLDWFENPARTEEELRAHGLLPDPAIAMAAEEAAIAAEASRLDRVDAARKKEPPVGGSETSGT